MAKVTKFAGTAAEQTVEEGEEKGGTKTEEDPKAGKAGDGEEGGADKGTKGEEGPDAGGESAEEGGDEGGEEGGGEGDEEEERAEVSTGITAENLTDAVKEAINAGKEPSNAADKFSIRAFTEADTEKLQASGVTHQGANLMGAMVNHVIKNLLGHVEGLMGPMQKESALAALAQEKGFEDIHAHRKQIDKLLGSFEPSHHGNPKVLRLVAMAARGEKTKGAVRKAASGRETNRRLAGRTRPQSPTSGGGKGKPGAKLTPLELGMAKEANMSPAEYIGWKTKK